MLVSANCGVYRMKFLQLVSLVACLSAPLGAWAEVFTADRSLRDFSSVQVLSLDGAKGGCWTNMGVAETYAADRLRSRGANVVMGKQYYSTHQNGHVIFHIVVDASRNGQWCYGTYGVKIQTFLEEGDRQQPNVIYSDRGGYAMDQGNFNNYVLDVISDAINEWY